VALERDPVRSLRAVRQAVELDFSIEAHTESLVRHAAPLLWSVSGERLRDEVVHLLALQNAGLAVRQLNRLSLLTQLLPELEPCWGLQQPLPHVLDVLEHSLVTLDAMDGLLPAANEIHPALEPYVRERLTAARPRSMVIKLAGLLHDVGKPGSRSTDEAGGVHFYGHAQAGARLTQAVLERFRFSQAEVKLAVAMVRHHMRPLQLSAQEAVSARAVYRFFRDTQDAGPATLVLALADHAATYASGAPNSEAVRLRALVVRMLRDYFEQHQTRVSPTPLLSGRDLLEEFSLKPGPIIGRLLESLREAQAAGEVCTRHEALGLVREHLKDA
jgi:poly(A) polymerase